MYLSKIKCCFSISWDVLNFVEKVTYACATKVYPNSNGLYEFIVNQQLGSSVKMKVIANGSSNGIDTTYFDSERISEEQRRELRTKLNIQNKEGYEKEIKT